MRRAILRDSLLYGSSSQKIKEKLEISVSTSSIRSVPSQSGKFRYGKERVCSELPSEHKSARMQWDRKLVQYTEYQLKNVIF